MIKLVITDLDDTLYSWIGFFIPAFYDMAEEVARIINIPKDELLAEYRQVHKKVGSVEFPHATLLLPSVQSKYEGLSKEQQLQHLDSAFHKFNSKRKKLLALYPGVENALAFLVEQNIKIVGYTESAEENCYFRLTRLGIEEYFAKVYVSDSLYERPDCYPRSIKTNIVHGKKPNPELLKQICKSEGTLLSETLYIGDSLSKDMLMAKQAGVHSAWVDIPVGDSELYSKLVAISHWTEADFLADERNKLLWKENGYSPDFVLHSFNEIPKIVQAI